MLYTAGMLTILIQAVYAYRMKGNKQYFPKVLPFITLCNYVLCKVVEGVSNFRLWTL